MRDLFETKAMVYEMLKEHEEARGCDELLYYLVCKRVLWIQGKPIQNMLLSSALLYRKELNLPKFESVRRARQKIQREHQWLKPKKKVQELRAAEEEKYKEFATS